MILYARCHRSATGNIWGNEPVQGVHVVGKSFDENLESCWVSNLCPLLDGFGIVFKIDNFGFPLVKSRVKLAPAG